MTRLTAMLIADDPEVYGASFGPVDGKFGLYVGTIVKTSQPIYATAPIYATTEAAKDAAEAVIAEARVIRAQKRGDAGAA